MRTCDNCTILRHEHLKDGKRYKCLTHTADTKEELMKNCMWKIGDRKKGEHDYLVEGYFSVKVRAEDHDKALEKVNLLQLVDMDRSDLEISRM